MKLSVVIPAHNEEGCLPQTLSGIVSRLETERVPHEILVVNDNSSDGTETVLRRLCATCPTLSVIRNSGPPGYGFAVRAGLDAFTGDAAAIVMADGSDSPDDIVRYYRTIEKGYDCAFGSRFMKGAVVRGYPSHKLLLNRLANLFIMALLGIRYNDVTNAFKCYRREVIDGIRPLLSNHFNLTVELPLKAIVRGYTYEVIPVSWTGREAGVSKLKIKEMGSRYLFIVLYVFLEKILARGDYRRDKAGGRGSPGR